GRYRRCGLTEVLDDVVLAAEWAPKKTDAHRSLVALRRVLGREAINLLSDDKRDAATFLQQVSWRYRDFGLPAAAFENALRSLGAAHVVAVQVSPNSDPSQLREAFNSFGLEIYTGRLMVHEPSEAL